MVVLAARYFGLRWPREAESLLARRSEMPITPRILGAFNEPHAGAGSRSTFHFFTDRDGNANLRALANPGLTAVANLPV